MNLPNKLTTLRMLLVIPFTILSIIMLTEVNELNLFSYKELNYATTLLIIVTLVFAFAMVTDFFDGYFARKNNQVTTYGKLFDPLADKFITTTTFIILSACGIVPIWVTIIFILRDLLVDGSRNIAAKNNIEVSASWWGKWKTALQSVGILLVMLVLPALKTYELKMVNPSTSVHLLLIPIYISLLLSIVSGWLYFKQIMPYIKMK